ncbi:hypothetical protein [Mesorhizobium sp. B2-1-3A]|uniref:hypothetical protein n=1 Tax=Mesorhizobium sp. B2-1-3A TaxID=2589971 RepID=UPI00112B7BE3|nr:hypothetical protein [Mesorhizobium sp. B2-1-3A]TPM94961.1 hypothetical protein FJ977_23140 [Mesorhizobium sp. B2-1-3A]
MAQPSNEIRDILAQSRAGRQALFGPVSELSRRLQPRHLVQVSKDCARQKVAGALGLISDAVKENGGTAGAVALGAFAVFDAGRRSVIRGDDGAETFARAGHADAGPSHSVSAAHRTVTELDRVKVLAGSAVALSFGHVIGRAFRTTAKERALFGGAGDEVRGAAAKFISEHTRGAKLAAAEAFGFAGYGATLLAILAVASDYFVRSEDIGNPPGNRSD